MQTRRHEGMVRKSAATKLRDRQYELGHDSFVASHREEQSMRSRSSFSPSRRDGSRRVASGDRNSNSIERRDRDWHMASGRTNRFRSRSPPYGQVLKKAPFEEDVMHRDRSSPPLELQRRYELSESMGNPDATSYHNSRSLHAYDHHNTSRISTDDDFGGHRSSDGMLVQKSMAMEDDEVRRSVRLHQDLGSTSTYKETGGPLSSATGNMGIRQFEDERVRYRNPLPFDKSSLMEHYKGGDKAMSYLRDIDRTLVPASQFQDFAGTSSGILTGDDRPSYRDAQHLPSNEFSKSSGKFTEALDFDGYGHGQRPLHHTARNREAELRDLSCYRRDAYSPEKAELRGYLYSTLGERGGNDFGYPRDDKKIQGHDRGEYDQMHLPSNSKVEYDQRDVLLHAGLEYDLRDESFHNRVDRHHKDGLRPSMMNSAAIYIDNIKSSHINFREGNVRDHPSQEQKISEYPNMSRILYSSKQDREYFDYVHSHAEYGGKVSQDREMSNLAAGMDHEVSQFPSNYDIRDASPGLPKERLKGSFVSEYDAEMDRLGIRRHRMDAEKLGIYDPSGRMLKRKYTMDEKISGYDSRSLASRKLDMPSVTRELNDVREKWIDEDIDDFYSSETVGFGHAQYRRADRVLDGRVHQRDLTYDNWFPTEDSHEHVQGRLSKSFHRRSDIHKYHRFIRGHPKAGSPRWQNSYHIKRRSDIHKYPRVLKWSSDDQRVDEHVDGDEPPKDQGYSAKSLAEDTEEFKQLVQTAFLKFSKKLNENPAVRRRYKEQGRAGSLFCIVCGRSLSKDFMDTRRLVTHAFMSYKSGLRAEHLGLHKAICVLLGWNSNADPDTVTWTPEVLSYEEALAQKEDLMLWPPLIIIHNSSILNNGPEDQKVAATEDLEAFLRGKGFVRGKIKVCLGKPADNSVMLVKFLGTFTGLEDANRIHKYFAENKRGRADFEQITVNNGRRCNDKDAGKQEDKLKELDLYGYMGISEDLDKVDFETRKRSLIRSKKEIRDLADDPVKPNER